MVDAGASGRSSDGGVLAAAEPPLGFLCGRATVDWPGDPTLPGAENLGPMPHIFVADEAFPLKLVLFFLWLIYHCVL